MITAELKAVSEGTKKLNILEEKYGDFFQGTKNRRAEKKGILHLGGEKEIGDIDYKPSPPKTGLISTLTQFMWTHQKSRGLFFSP